MRDERIYEKIFDSWYEPMKSIIYTDKFEKFLMFLEEKYRKGSKKLLPDAKSVFKPFLLCDWSNIHTVILFSRKSFDLTSNGLAFGQKNCCLGLNYETDLFYKCLEFSKLKPFNLAIDETLESFAKQGFLLLNTSYTLENYNKRQHLKFWYRFNIELFKILSLKKDNINYILIGQDAWKYSKYITGKNNDIFKVESFLNAEQCFRDWKFDLKIVDLLIRYKNKKVINWY